VSFDNEGEKKVEFWMNPRKEKRKNMGCWRIVILRRGEKASEQHLIVTTYKVETNFILFFLLRYNNGGATRENENEQSEHELRVRLG
jgi:hypothetical protein